MTLLMRDARWRVPAALGIFFLVILIAEGIWNAGVVVNRVGGTHASEAFHGAALMALFTAGGAAIGLLLALGGTHRARWLGALGVLSTALGVSGMLFPSVPEGLLGVSLFGSLLAGFLALIVQIRYRGSVRSGAPTT